MMNTAHSAALAPELDRADIATWLQQMRDEERADLARELHDELGSLLTGAKLEVATLKLRLGSASGDIAQRLTHLSATINSGIAFSRRVVEGLHPSSLTNLGLVASLEILAREFRQSTGIAMAMDLEEVELDQAAQLTAYRVVQESLNNTSKYARATDARIVMMACGGDVMMTVSDNGAGFETAAVGTASHGLAGMHHRVGACGGQLTVSSTPGGGTLVVAVLPGQAGGRVTSDGCGQITDSLQKVAATRLFPSPGGVAQRSSGEPAARCALELGRWPTASPRARRVAR